MLAEISMDIRGDPEALALFLAAGAARVNNVCASSQGWSARSTSAPATFHPACLQSPARSRSAAMRLCLPPGPSGEAPTVDESAGHVSGVRVAAHHDVSVVATLEVRIEDRLPGRAPAQLSLQSGTAKKRFRILQTTSTATCVVHKPLKRASR
jgi:hypothetical protein